MSRRKCLGGGAALLAYPGGLRAAGAVRRFRVLETAGLRRFGYPVQVTLADVPDAATCRLIHEGRPLAAQFRSVDGPGGKNPVVLDFNVSLGPLETREYQVHIGDAAAPGYEPGRGLKVEESGGCFRISGTGTDYDVPANLAGFLRQVRQDPRSYLRGVSRGLWIQSGGRDPKPHELQASGLRGSIERKGPLAVGLRFDAAWGAGASRIPAVAELTFPASKSWVELAWTVDDGARDDVTELGLDLDLAIDGSPTLIDFGATGTVYSTIQDKERIWLEGNPGAGWDIFKDEKGQASLQATSRRGPGGPAEGWVHVMDAARCTAVAVAGFGLRSRDRIEASADGRLRLRRSFDRGARGSRELRAWFHFVNMPVQVGAATSPQSMLAPLKVEWL